MNEYQYIFEDVKNASHKLLGVSNETIKKVLSDLAELASDQSEFLIAENRKDLDRMVPTNPMYDRLLLDENRIQNICDEIHQVLNLPSPLHEVLESKTLDNGLELKKVSVPLGVIGVIYEARPNVTFDVFALAIKSGNGLILKGGSDAEFSNLAIMLLIHRVLEKNNIPQEAFQLLPTDRSATKALLEAVGLVDVIIPRGSQSLISFVRENAKVPVIETGAGIVHTYISPSADIAKAKKIILNAKTRRPSVCNSLDCLIIHSSHLEKLNEILEPLLEHQVEIFADQRAFGSLATHPLISPAQSQHFGTEFLSLKLAIKTVDSIEEAIEHIQRYSSQHSEAILSENPSEIDQFLLAVDAAAVYVNASTAFTDGAQFGLGAEIGISTQKLHARGPMGLKELTSYKWIVRGNGQVRT
ncbi:glutamate-5-semialdehyde dehydrogenase [Algoriphagus namhaensis]|uniref:Gamma-glutamyl phosphate reductase n=1 Tax=Algoriphagus namhaensis TaxID=915353 RepID=A0ABV8AQT3_9BACT